MCDAVNKFGSISKAKIFFACGTTATAVYSIISVLIEAERETCAQLIFSHFVFAKPKKFFYFRQQEKVHCENASSAFRWSKFTPRQENKNPFPLRKVFCNNQKRMRNCDFNGIDAFFLGKKKTSCFIFSRENFLMRECQLAQNRTETQQQNGREKTEAKIIGQKYFFWFAVCHVFC